MNAATSPLERIAVALTDRAALIASVSDDIACGHASGRYNAAYFLDSLMDENRVTANDVAILLTMNEHTDAHIDVADRVRELVEAEAVKFFTDDARGKDHINDLLAERVRAAA